MDSFTKIKSVAHRYRVAHPLSGDELQPGGATERSLCDAVERLGAPQDAAEEKGQR